MRTWMTEGGVEIPLNKMGDDHLTNAILMLERNAKKRALIVGGKEKGWENWLSFRYKYLVAEVKRRAIRREARRQVVSYFKNEIEDPSPDGLEVEGPSPDEMLASLVLNLSWSQEEQIQFFTRALRVYANLYAQRRP